jgi:mitogen-activated protein kinase organizer 1
LGSLGIRTADTITYHRAPQDETNNVKKFPCLFMAQFTEIQHLTGHTAPVRVVKFNSNGKYCMSGGYDKQIILWNPYEKKQIKTFKGHGYQVMDLAISYDNGAFVSCGGDKQPFLWDVGTGAVVRKLRGHTQMVNSVSFNSDASIFISGSYDQTAKIWDCKSNSIDAIQVLDQANDSVTGVTFGNFEIFTCSVDGCLRAYDLRMGQLRTDHLGVPITSLSLSLCERMILLSCLDGTLKVIDRADGSLIREFSGHQNKEFKIDSSFFQKDSFALTGSEDGSLHAWKMESGVESSTNAHQRMVSGISCHPEGEFVMTSSSDTTLKLWSITTDQQS